MRVTLAKFSTTHTLTEARLIHLVIRWCIFHDPAFALLVTIPGVTDGPTDGHVAVAKTALCIASRW